MWEFWQNRRESKQISRMPSLPGEGLVTAVAQDGTASLGNEEQLAYSQAEDQLPAVPSEEPHIYFKDLKLLAHNHPSSPFGDQKDQGFDEEFQEPGAGGAESLSDGSLSPMGDVARTPSKRAKLVDRQRLVIILVGLPARGKTFLCNKLMCYLNWLGHSTKHFNVGNYRRKQQAAGIVQNADFFDSHNPNGVEARQRALLAALDDLEAWLQTEGAQVAIFDATNSTHSRRDFLRTRFHGKWQYMFLESICNDTSVLENNYKLKMMYSPDYQGMDTETALTDFRERIKKYTEVYETIEDRTMHYVKLIDMVTGRGYMDVNRISGYIPGKMVFFLMQVCKAGVARPRRIWLTRHGESQYNVKGLIGGNSNLSPRGVTYARLLPDILNSRVPVGRNKKQVPVAVWTSTLARTIATASLLSLPKVQWKALDEIQAGNCDGLTYADIAEHMPEEYVARKRDKLRYRYPFGESYMDVIQRLEPVVIEVEREREGVCIVAHQAVLRALYGYFMNKPLEDIPSIDIPLHTLIELAPKADGTMAETRFRVDVDKAMKELVHLQDPDGYPDGYIDPSSTSTGGGGGGGKGGISGSDRLGSSSSSRGGDASRPPVGSLPSDIGLSGFSGGQRTDADGLVKKGGIVKRSLSMAELSAAEVVKVTAENDDDI